MIPVCADDSSSSGFRGIKWGTDIGSLTDFSPLTLAELNSRLGMSYPDVPGTEYFIRKDEKLLIGDIPITGIYYFFYHKMLFQVYAICPKEGAGSVQHLLEKKYGAPELKVQGPPKFHWDTGDVIIDFKPIGRNYWIIYQYQQYAVEYEKKKNEMSKRLEEEKEKKMEEALNDI